MVSFRAFNFQARHPSLNHIVIIKLITILFLHRTPTLYC